MYTSFRIQNFRGFKDFELKDIKRVNLIAGKNNVGKTSLLEAVLAYVGENEAILDRTRLRSGDISRRRTEIISEREELKLLFNQFDITSTIQFSGIRPHNSVSSLMSGNLEITFASLDNVHNSSLHPISNGNLELSAKNIVGLLFKMDDKEINFVRRGQVSINKNSLATIVKSYISVPSVLNRYRFSSLKRERRIEFLVDILKIIEPQLRDLELLESGIYGDIATLPELIPLNSMGQGFGRIITILLAISAVEDGIIAIDEIENGLHYSIQKEVWKAIDEASKAFNVQVFATTHSREMVMAAHEAFKDAETYDFKYYRLDRNVKTHEIEAVAYSERIMEAAEEMDAEVRG